MYDKLLSVVNVRHTNKYLNRCLLQIGDDSDEKGNSDGAKGEVLTAKQLWGDELHHHSSASLRAEFP